MQEVFPSGLVTYTDFVGAVRKFLNKPMERAYLLDRVILSDPARGFTASPTQRGSNDTEQPSLDKQVFPLDFLLVAFNLCIGEGASFRCQSLFPLVADPSTATVPTANVLRLLDCLVRTCQLPAEKLVTESGRVIPYATHTTATPAQLLAKVFTELKLQSPSTVDTITEEQFYKLLISESICAWGECYRSSGAK